MITRDSFLEDEPVIVKTHKGVTLLIDADIIAFQSAATTDGREYRVDGQTFKYKSDAVKHCVSGDIDKSLIELHYCPEPVDFAIRNVNTSVQMLKKKFPGIKMEFYLTGKTNFRHQLTDDYKENRKDKRRPAHLKACREHILKRYKGVIVEGLEADDCMSIRQAENLAMRDPLAEHNEVTSIIGTIDKDLNTCWGWHYNWRKDSLYFIEPLEATRNFYCQCLMGDNSDHIKGLKGIGPKTAEKLLKEANSEEEMYEIVRDKWISHFFPGFFTKERDNMDMRECLERHEEIIQDLHVSAKLLYILHEEDVMWSVPLKVL
jgi:hypothetical protein